MTSIIITVLCQILGFVLDWMKVKKETKEKFLEFVSLAANDTKSVSLMKYGEQQKQWLKDNPWKAS